MKLDVDLTGLERALKSIGGQKVSIGQLRRRTKLSNPLELMLLENDEVIIDRPEDLENITHPASLIAIGNTQVSLHILHTHENKESLSQSPAQKTRFHIAECSTLDRMKQSGRFDRYVAGKRLDQLFTVTPFDRTTQVRGNKMEAKLAPCFFCLKTLNYHGFEYASNERRRKITSSFSLQEFFEDNESIFRCLPLYTTETMPDGNYTKDWSTITYKYREKIGWKCECCSVDLSKARRLLHSHHKDGNKGNNKFTNLRALCVTCHKAQENHGQMHVTAKEKMHLIELKTKQLLDPNCKNC